MTFPELIALARIDPEKAIRQTITECAKTCAILGGDSESLREAAGCYSCAAEIQRKAQ